MLCFSDEKVTMHFATTKGPQNWKTWICNSFVIKPGELTLSLETDDDFII